MGTAKDLSSKVKRILITGGGGFVGRALVKRLLPYDVEIRVLGRNTYDDLSASGVDCYLGDIASHSDLIAASKNVDLVFHVAAKAGIWGKWDEYYNANCLGTENVLTACRENDIKKLVYTSTPSVVFNGEDICGAGHELAHATHFLCNYAKSKSIAEKNVLAAASDSFHVCAIRPHLIWGPGDPHLLPRLVEAGKKGALKRVGEGRNLVDISYIDNVAEAHLCAALALFDEKRLPVVNGQAYFIGQQEPVNLWGWINELFSRLQIAEIKDSVSFKTAYRLGAILEVVYSAASIFGNRKEPPMTRFVAEQLAKSHYFSHDTARDELLYRELVSTDEGMRRCVEWLQQKEVE